MTTTTATVYVCRAPEPRRDWALVTVCEKYGMLAVASDYGSWVYIWNAPGMPFKDFLVKLANDPEYLVGKLCSDLNMHALSQRERARREETCRLFVERLYVPVFVPALAAT